MTIIVHLSYFILVWFIIGFLSAWVIFGSREAFRTEVGLMYDWGEKRNLIPPGSDRESFIVTAHLSMLLLWPFIVRAAWSGQLLTDRPEDER